MPRKQIVQFDAAVSIASTDRFLLQQGAAGTEFTHGTIQQIADAAADITAAALASGPSYDDDAAAASGGIAVGQMYRNGNFLMVRLT